jgi:hypothetical protein
VHHHPIGTPDRGVFYGISTSGLANDPGFSETGFLPAPLLFPDAEKFLDPMAAASPTSDNLWIGCVALDVRSGPSVTVLSSWRNAAGTGGLQLATPVVTQVDESVLDDKGCLAIGPVNGGAESVYLAFTRRFDIDCGGHDYMMWARWNAATPPTSAPLAFDSEQRIDPDGPSACDREAFGVSSLVTSSGPNTGRLVVAYRLGTVTQHDRNIQWCFYNQPVEGPPQVDGWSTSDTFDLDSDGNDIFGYNSVSIPGTFAAQNFPSMAQDPSEPDIVYIAFAGAATAPSSDQNVDIYIAQINFLFNPPTVEVKRITDAQLGDEDGTDQFFPAVTVDGYGGINLAYVKVPVTSPVPLTPDMRIMYTRKPNWATPPSSDTLLALTPFFRVPHNPSNPTDQGIDEYISIASSGCLIYVSHFECEPEYNYTTTNVYVTRISICPADTDDNGFVQQGDVAAFGAAYVAQSQPADINRDGVCNGTDVEKFFNAYNCGCGTPQ